MWIVRDKTLLDIDGVCGIPDEYHVGDVVIAEPGVTVQELYEFADQNDFVVVGAFCPSVGVFGGWLLGGGTGFFSPVYGLGVDSKLHTVISFLQVG